MENWEQGTRNYSGSRVRTFTGSNKLHARLSCKKNLVQHVGMISPALLPVDYDEDVELECRDKIVMQNGRKAYRKARAFGIQPMILADEKPFDAGPCYTPARILRDELCQEAIRRWYNGSLYNNSRLSRRPLAALQAAIIELKQRFNKSLWLRYTAGELDEVELLCAAGLICKAP